MSRSDQPASPPASGARKLLAVCGAALLTVAAVYLSQSAPAPAVHAAEDPKKDEPKKLATPAAGAVAAANTFLDSLDAKLKEKAALKYDSDKKPKWSNLPVSFTPRNGVKLGELTKEQREKAMAVVAAVLSKDGYQKVIDIMDGDQQLAEGKGGGKGGKGGKDGGAMFGKELYYLALFGEPSETKPWMVQFGGHHLGVNVTVIGKQFILTPSHTGAQPALFKRGEKDVRPLGAENDSAAKLFASLDEKQRPKAVIGERTQNLLLGPGEDGKKLGEPKGIKGADLTKDQQAMLLDVIAAWENIAQPEAAAARLAAIKETLGQTYFAWSGPANVGKAAYFRIQGPAVIIEYAPQGGTDHIHTVIRHPDDDYGVGSAKQ